MGKQKYTEAKKEGNRRWDSQNLDRFSVAVPKGQKEKIKAHADSTGESINGFVNRAIDETIQRDSNPLKNEQVAQPVAPKPVHSDSETERARKALLDKLKGL